MKHIHIIFLFLLILMAGCRKTEDFYNQLDQLPRINKLDNTAYAVGDTLTLTGKFGAGKATLKITVGGVDAAVISITTKDSTYTEKEVLYNYTFDKVKVLITEAMIGQQQLVVATVNGTGSTLASILVSKDRPVPARSDTLNYLNPKQATVALRMPLGTRVIPSYTPGGAIVFMNGDSLITWKEGVIRRGKVTWKDSYGDFSILDPNNIDYGFASDPAGNYLYISCLTSDAQLPADATKSAARLMKVSLRDYSVTTLNRTVLPTSVFLIDATDIDFDKVKKEGNIGEVTFPVMKKIYTNSKGELFFSCPSFNWSVADGVIYSTVPTNLTIARLNASGTFQYLAKGAAYDNKIFQVYIIKDGELNFDYDFLPNVTTVFNYNRLMGIDAENGLLYGYVGTESGSIYNISSFYCYNILQQRQLGEFSYKLGSSSLPTITDGPFNVVEGGYSERLYSTLVSQWPSPGQPMVIFAQQQKPQQLNLPGQARDSELKSVKMINFSNHTVSTYAPFIQSTTPGSEYQFGIGGDVVGYTASKQPVMVRTNEIDPAINEVLLLAPVK
jgi:hypothetical protein